MKGKIHYNGRLGYYLPLKRDQIKSISSSEIDKWITTQKISKSDIIDDATGEIKTDYPVNYYNMTRGG